MQILVIEDDPVIGKALTQGFSESGHECQWLRDGVSGAARAREQWADAIVLDLMLPQCDGMQVLRELRSDGIETPVIVLTAKGDIDDRVEGLTTGADDYLVKPFAIAELMARLNAVQRRTSLRPSSLLQSAGLTLNRHDRGTQAG